MTYDLTKIKIRQIEAFRNFMLTGSVTHAAQLMCISQPAVSRLLSDLEYRIGFALFIRSHNKIEPTPEAYLFYQEVERLFVGMDALTQSALAILQHNRGHLRLGALPVCAASFLPAVIAEFVEQCPDVVIEMESAPRSRLLEMIRSKRTDMAIVTDMDAKDTTYDCHWLTTQKAVVVMHPDNPLRHKGVLSAQDVAHERFMVLTYGSPFRIRVEDAFIRQRIKRNIVFEAREQSILLELVKKGVGIALLDPLIIPKNTTAVITRPFCPSIEWSYFAVHLGSTRQPATLCVFTQLLEHFFHNLPKTE